jgi:hypothetical protein
MRYKQIILMFLISVVNTITMLFNVLNYYNFFVPHNLGLIHKMKETKKPICAGTG